MIESIEDERIGVRCAECNQRRDVRLRGLEVRTLDSSTAIVALPTCRCGAFEFLVRATRPAPVAPGGMSHRHQLLVDHLHAELVRGGRVARESKDAEKVCPPVPAAELEHWFPSGLSLSASEPGEVRR
jgi:hypothetical protein